MNRTLVCLPLVLLVILVLAPPVQAGCADAESGSVMVPNPRGEIAPHTKPQVAQGTTAYYITDLRPGTSFQLEADRRDITNCLPGGCLAGADFNVVFFSDFGLWMAPMSHSSAFGDESGTVPAGATWAAVYLRAAPGNPSIDDPADYPFRFTFRQGC